MLQRGIGKVHMPLPLAGSQEIHDIHGRHVHEDQQFLHEVVEDRDLAEAWQQRGTTSHCIDCIET